MPTRAPKLCPWCHESYRGGRCLTCTDSQAERGRLLRLADPVASPYDTPAWRRVSAAYLRSHPYCECGRHGGLPVALRPFSQVVDHIDGLGPEGPHGFSPENFQALTRSCHASKTAAHDGGYGNRIVRVQQLSPL